MVARLRLRSNPIYKLVFIHPESADLMDMGIFQRLGDGKLGKLKFGLREVELDTGADAIGAAWTVKINGREVWCKGANWIPDDVFLPRANDPARLRGRLQQAKDAGMNMIRVWGGGIYETDAFYDICDELGLLVWQDFLFACAAYSEANRDVAIHRGRGALQRDAAEQASESGAVERVQREHLGLLRLGLGEEVGRQSVGRGLLFRFVAARCRRA